MREIKFRVWVKPIKEMIHTEMPDWSIMFSRSEPLVEFWCNDGPFDSFSGDAIELMQYTGLKDRNGVEIYEGDVVKASVDDEDSCTGRQIEHIGEVVYSNGGKCLFRAMYPTSFCILSDDFYLNQALLGISRYEYEIIGNIHENPELLEVKS